MALAVTAKLSAILHSDIFSKVYMDSCRVILEMTTLKKT